MVRVRAGALEPTKRRFPCDDGTGRLPRLFVAMSLQVLASQSDGWPESAAVDVMMPTPPLREREWAGPGCRVGRG